MPASYEKKTKRRQIRAAFTELKKSGSNPSPKEIREFLIAFKDNFNEMRQSLEPEKNTDNAWAKEIWRLLKFDNNHLLSEIAELINEKKFLIESTKMQLRTRVNNSLILSISISANGPNYDDVNSEFIRKIIQDKLEKPIASFTLDVKNVTHFPGTYPLELNFGDNNNYPISLTIDIANIPELPSEIRKHLPEGEFRPLIELKSNKDVKTLLSQEILKLDEKVTDDIDRLAIVYYIINKFGFSKTVEANRLLRKWYSLYEEKNRGFEFNSLSATASVQFNAEQMIEGLSLEEREKLQILNLPPLVLSDLINARTDLNVLKLIINSFPDYSLLRGKSIAELTNDDIKSLSPRGRWKSNGLKLGREYADSRTIAKVLITTARLFFERLRVGTMESDIRYCLSSYCTRFGQYLIEQHGRYDLARELFIEAITLNRTSGSHSIDFPASLLFRSFVKAKNAPPPNAGLTDFIKLIEHNTTDKEETLKTAIRSILELGNQQQDLTLRWFLHYEGKTKENLLNFVRPQLKQSSFADLSECIDEYRKQMNEFHAIFTHLYECNSIQAIVQNRKFLQEKIDELGFLINPTNREILGALQQVIYSLENHLRASHYIDQKSNLETAKNQLEKILGFGADNYTSLWAQHLRPIASRWTKIIDEELKSMSKENIAAVKVSLAEEYISYYEKTDLTLGARVIYRIENYGNAPAKRINISFTSITNEEFVTQKSNYDLGASEVTEDYFPINSEGLKENITLNYSGTFYNLDGQKTEFNCSEPIIVQLMKPNESLQKLVNPFQSDKEVDDEKMFVGRSLLLEELTTYAIDQPSGSLLMLHGQRRVGKSSLLLFLEKNIDLVSIERKYLGVKITWLNYTKHKAHHLWRAISREIQYKLKKEFKLEINIPNEAAFEESYTVAFNAVLDELRYADINRLILLWDEFDGIVNLISKDEYNYDRLFFEYLRGLSKRKNFALVLTGGELMPILFERWGEVFNHDRTWRIAYLSPTDGSVEKLIKNEYVEGIVTFSEEAINLIKYYSACNPFFIQMICRDLVTSAKNNNSPHVCKLDVEETVEHLVKHGLEIKYVKHLYTPRLESDPLDLAMIGVVAEEEIENKNNTYVDKNKILARFPNRSEDKAINKLGELVRREILDQNPNNKNEYRVKLPMFRDWFYDNNPEYELWVPELKR